VLCSASNKSIAFHHLLVLSKGAQLAELAKHFDDGKLKAHIDKVFSLDQAADALKYVDSGRVTGKVVVHIVDEPKQEEKKA